MAALAIGSLVPAPASEVPAPAAAKPAKVVVIPVRAEIAPPELYIIRRGLKEAIEQKVDTVVLDMNTPGGRLDVTFEILKALEKFPGKTITYVNREAVSAGAFISAGTDEIHFAPGAVIGAAAPVNSDGGDIGATMHQKIVSYLKARIRSISEGKGYRGDVISAMIDTDAELKIGDKVIKPKGELLSLTSTEAMVLYGDPPKPLLGSGVSEDLDALLDGLHGRGNYTVQRLEITWSEKLAQYITVITPILLGLGMLALVIEFKTPGFGFFGITGLTLVGIVFAGQYVAGLSGHEPALFFLLGMVLLAAEIVVLPGTFVLAIAGVTLMLGSLVWSMADLWPSQPVSFSGEVFLRPLASVMGGIALAVVFFFAALRYLPDVGPWKGMVLNAAVGGEPSPVIALTGGGSSRTDLVGETGVATTALFPSGQVEIGGRRYEARLALGHADAGTPVKVTGLGEFGLTVEVLS